MKDYSKVKYVKPSVDGYGIFRHIHKDKYITKGKIYEVSFISALENTYCTVLDDEGREILIIVNGQCAHLMYGRWIPCDKDGNEIEV